MHIYTHIHLHDHTHVQIYMNVPIFRSTYVDIYTQQSKYRKRADKHKSACALSARCKYSKFAHKYTQHNKRHTGAGVRGRAHACAHKHARAHAHAPDLR